MSLKYCFMAAVILPAAFLANLAEAAFVPPSFRESPPVSQTSYQAWDNFGAPGAIIAPFTPDGSTFNAPSTNNPFGTPTLTATNPGSIITSTGNIYTPTGVGGFDVYLPGESGAFDWTKVVVQVLGTGTELDVNSLTLTGLSGTYQADDIAVELSNVPSGNPFGGNLIETWFQFDVPTYDDEYTLSFAAVEANFSLSRIEVDVAWGGGVSPGLEELPPGEQILLYQDTGSGSSGSALPEPGTGALLCGGWHIVYGDVRTAGLAELPACRLE